jgi:hypothetical protein
VNEWPEHEIAALRLNLRAEIQSADRLLNGLVRALVHEHMGPPLRVAATSPGGIPMPQGDQLSSKDDDPPTSDPKDDDPIVIDVEVVVRRVTWHDDDRHPATERLQDVQDAFKEYVAKNAMDAAWNPITELWITPDYDGAASFAEGLSDVQGQWHYLVLGRPVESAGYQMNLDSASVEVFAGIAAEFALPGDTSIKNIKRMVQVTGIVVGIASGQPLLADACFKSWLHDVVTGAAAKALTRTCTNTSTNTDVQQRVDETHQGSEDLDRRLESKAGVERAHAEVDALGREGWYQRIITAAVQQDWERKLASDERDWDRDNWLRRQAADERAAESDGDGSGS